MLTRSSFPARPSMLGKWILIALSVFLGTLGTWGVSRHMIATSDGRSSLLTATVHAAVTASAVRGGTTVSSVPGGTTSIANSIIAQDTFARQDQTFWGIASYGQAWQGDAAQNPLFSISGQTGIVAGAQQVSFCDAVLGPTMTDSMVIFSGAINNFQNATLGAVLRWQDANNWYKAYLNGKNLDIKKSVNGQVSFLAFTPFAALPNLGYTIRFRIVGRTLQARAWQTGMNEPTSWMLTFTDTGPGLSTGLGGLRLSLQAGTRVRITSFMEASLL